MSLTFGLTGMDPATETALKAAFSEANTRLGGQWQLVPEQEASHVVVDMDSMYGPMSWLRLHGAGKVVIGLTSAPRTQTDFRLTRPFNTDSVADLLQQIAPAAAPAQSPPRAAPRPAEPAAPHGLTPAPAPQDQLPEEQPRLPGEEAAAPDQRASAAVAATLDTPLAPPVRAPEPPSAAPPAPSATAPLIPAVQAPPVAKAVPPRPRTLTDWLAPGQLRGRVRLQRGGTTLLIDIDQRQYYGPATLKPLTAHLEEAVETADFTPIDTAGWTREVAALGQPQSLSRLLWFGALLAGKGQLAPGFDATAQYRLLKWPQTEREFPKHFRIATAMMKAPATLTEIAAASGVTTAEVADFVNASLATGYAEQVREPGPEPESQKPSGLFGRLRGR